MKAFTCQAFAVMLLVACGQSVPSPQLRSVTPSQGTSQAPVAITIAGTGLIPRVHADFLDSTKSSLNDTFTVSLGTFALQDVALTAAGTLTATVPADLPQATYDLTVVDPLGRQATLPQAYQVISAAEDVASFTIAPIADQHMRMPFTVTITAAAADGLIVEGFTGAVQLTDQTGELSPTTSAPFSFGQLGLSVAINALSASDTLTVTDAFGHTGTSNVFAVKPGLAAQLALTSAPQTLVAGQCSPAPVTVAVEDQWGLPTPVDATVDVSLSAGPPDQFAFYADATCANAITHLPVAAGQATAQFFFVGGQAGPIAVVASSTSLPSGRQVETVTPAAPTRLAFAAAPVRFRANTCSPAVTVEVHDAFDNVAPTPSAVSVTVSANPATGVTFSSDDTCANAGTSFTIAPGASTGTFHMTALSPATVVLQAAPTAPSTLTSASGAVTVLP